MVKEGGKVRVRAESYRGGPALISDTSAESGGSTGEDDSSPSREYRILRHASVKMELPHFVKTGSAPECVSRRSSIRWRSSSRLSIARRAWRSTTTSWRWWSRSHLVRTIARPVQVVVGGVDHTIAWRNGGSSSCQSGASWYSWLTGCDEWTASGVG